MNNNLYDDYSIVNYKYGKYSHILWLHEKKKNTYDNKFKNKLNYLNKNIKLLIYQNMLLVCRTYK